MAKRVLFIPHNFRHAYFHGFVKHAVATRDWTVAILCPEEGRKAFSSAIGPHGEIFPTPDFAMSAAWEDDPKKRDRIAALMEACESRTGISVNRILLAGERDIGRAYSKEFYYWNENHLARLVLRRPEEAQRVLERMFHFADEMVETFRPDFIASGATAAPIYLVLSLIAEVRGIPYLVNRRSKIHPKRCLWTLDRAMLADLTWKEYRVRAAAAAPVSDYAKDYLKNFGDSPETIQYISNHWRNAAALRKWSAWHKHVVMLAVLQLVYMMRGRKGLRPKSAWLQFKEYYRVAYLRLRHRPMMRRFSDGELQAMKYIYLPFHKEPEMAINVQAYPWHSQKNTVKFLSSLLPSGYRLLVREHRGVWGRRPTAFYRSLRMLPGVEVIDPFDNQFKYICNAALIITENGSTGWEGLLLRRPVITLHENFYDMPGLTHKVGPLVDLNAKIIELLRDPKPLDIADYERRMGWLIDSEWKMSLPEDDTHHDESFLFIKRLLQRTDTGAAQGMPKT